MPNPYPPSRRPSRELRLPPCLRFARREPSAVLLAVQLGAVLLYPFMEDSDAGRALFSVFGIGVLGLVLLAVRSTPARNLVRGAARHPGDRPAPDPSRHGR